MPKRKEELSFEEKLKSAISLLKDGLIHIKPLSLTLSLGEGNKFNSYGAKRSISSLMRTI